MTASPRHPLDRSVAFTALLEFCPGFGKTEARAGEQIVTRFLDGFYASGSKDMAAYARTWVTADPMTCLNGQVGVLGVALAQWSGRDTAADKAAVRQAANTAMGAVDELLRQLYVLRSRLVSEIRASDDVAAERTDALLERLRGERP